MGKLNIAKLANDIKSGVSKHSPEILTGIGIAGMVATTVLAVKATPKALELIKNEQELAESYNEELTQMDKVKACWKCYIPAAVTGVMSITCLIGASSVNTKRNAALTAAYTLSDSALREYREKVVETIGEKKEKTIKDKISEDTIKQNPVTKSEVYITDKGDSLCFEPMSGRYFKSDIDKIKRAKNNLNEKILVDAFNAGVSLNDCYEEIGLPKTSMGENLGWNLDTGIIDIYLSAQITDEGTPCLVINYTNPPKYDF